MGLFSKKKIKKDKDEQLEKVEDVKVAPTQEAEVLTETSGKKKKVKKEDKKKEIKHDHKDAYKNLIRPIITEKSSFLGMNNQYIFEVSPKSNKIEIKKSIKALYGVEPLKINIVQVKGKLVGNGRNVGNMKNWKKAIVTLKQGDKIEIYEGV